MTRTICCSFSKSREEAASRIVSDTGWDIKEVDFYTAQGQRLIPKGDGSGAYRLVPHGRPDKKNLQALFARACDIVLSGIPTIKDISDLKKALLWEDTI